MSSILLASTYIKCLKHGVQYLRGAKCKATKKYMYIVVRTDIPKVHQLVQTCHSAIDAGNAAQDVTGVHLVVLSVPDKDALESVAYHLENEQIEYKMFSEGYNNIGYTSLTTLPIPKLEHSILCVLDLLVI